MPTDSTRSPRGRGGSSDASPGFSAPRPTALAQVLAGRQRIRRETTERVLASRPAPARGALVDAARTWRLIDGIRRATGWSEARIARELGAGTRLQIGQRRVLRSTADKVDDLAYRVLRWGERRPLPHPGAVVVPFRRSRGQHVSSPDRPGAA